MDAIIVSGRCSSDSSEVLYVSPAYKKVWGRTCESLHDQPRSWFETVHPDDQERVKHAFENMNTREPEIEYRIVHADGSIRWSTKPNLPRPR
ncbi:MAG: PAS domain-containing protein [candidate division Zixibacteria bacterium]|nr:PAS domain-containing protein [candidate division Zixibacteria bacterium]